MEFAWIIPIAAVGGLMILIGLFAVKLRFMDFGIPMAWAGLSVLFAITVIFLLALHAAAARDSGQWESGDPSIREWYQSLMQPDVPAASCCGEADAYFADEIRVRDGKTYAVITDDRPDEPRRRPHIDIGTEFEVPNNKLKWDRGNPTGHGVIFLSRQGYVFCFVQPGGA